MARRSRELGTVLALALVLVGALPAHSASVQEAPTVSLSMPLYDSPGAMIPAVVTVWNAPAGYDVTFEVALIGGDEAVCTGPIWHNPGLNTTSQECYQQLPIVEGSYFASLRAILSAAGQADILVSGVSSRAILADGYPSPVPMTIEHAQSIERCGNSTPYVWLTIDDSINPTKLKTVFQLAELNNVRFHFFLTGKFLAKHPRYPRKIRRHGHVLGNHTYGHKALSRLSDDRALSQIDRWDRAQNPRLLRPPYAAGAFSTRLEGLAAKRDLGLCRWTVDTGDWRGDEAPVLIDRVANGDSRTRPVQAGGVILMHGHGEHTMEALQGIIDAVRDAGLQLEPLH